MEESNIKSSEDVGFAALGLDKSILERLKHLNFETPTAIQKLAIPVILQGRDVLATAQTGTGKTAAFALPILEKILGDRKSSALVMTPTRELAMQVCRAFMSFIGKKMCIETALLIGGERYDRQLRQLQKNPQIIVGTPGRINDHLQQNSLCLDNIRYLVLDETDRMLDMGFGVQIEAVLRYIPKQHQTLLFSATLPKEILHLAQHYLVDAQRILSGEPNRPIEAIQQESINVSDEGKYGVLIEQLNTRNGSVLVFVRTRRDAEFIARRLSKDTHHAMAIHGNLQQRQRSRVIMHFREKKCRILVATDVAARGLDIPHIEHVINYDLPQCPEDYVHRIGRTARAGASGSALCLITPGDRGKWNAINRLINPDKYASSEGRGRNGGGGEGHSGGYREGFRKKRGVRSTWSSHGQRGSRDDSRFHRHASRNGTSQSFPRRSGDFSVRRGIG
ncbi:MAG: DEAD/DEAH box helicase [Puniceicoccales bacterium]|jgi:superfamily II DNA/RNA helicase|nr:DEAD/DEAH box helicase [Puniceicoccales bacterium]